MISLSKELKKGKLIEMYRKMLEIRHFEKKVFYLFLQGVLPGTIHLYSGQEAVAVGVCANLKSSDFIVSTHRPFGHYIAKGGSIDKAMAELFAKKTGCCKAKGGSMHVGDISIGMPPSIAIVGAGIPVAAGIGLSFKLKGTSQVVACFFGDGACHTGDFHEGMNLAAIWRLPVLFICENNLYSASTSLSKVTLLKDMADMAASYGIPGLVVDGNDVIAVYKVVADVIKRARQGEGPSLIECKTYRQGGHSRGDPAKYRPQKEVEEWLKKDPVSLFKMRLIEERILTEKEVEGIEKETIVTIERAVKFAEDAPSPKAEDALGDLYG